MDQIMADLIFLIVPLFFSYILYTMFSRSGKCNLHFPLLKEYFQVSSFINHRPVNGSCAQGIC